LPYSLVTYKREASLWWPLINIFISGHLQ